MSAAPGATFSARLSRLAPPLGALGLAAALFGLGLVWHARANTDLFAPEQLVAEAQLHLLPTLAGGSALSHHFTLAHGWSHGAIALFGQWDARLLSIATLALGALALALFLLQALRVLPWRGALWLAGGAAALAVLGGARPAPTGEAALSLTWALLTLAQLQLTAPERSAGARTLGWLLSALNLACSTLGLAPALVLAIRELHTLSPRARLAASSALLAAGVTLTLWRSGSALAPADGFAWPLPLAWAALLLWAPAIYATARWLTSRDPGDRALAWAGPLAASAVGAVFIFALLGQQPPREWMWCALAVNAASLVALPRTSASQAARSFCLATAWAIVVANGVVQWPSADDRRLALERTEDSSHGLADPLAATRTAAASLWARAELQPYLPASRRAPLPLTAESAPAGFASARPANLEAPDALPHWSTWQSAAPGALRGEFRSAPLHTPAAVVQVRVAGTLRPPETELVLVTSDGREIAPLETGFTIESRWKRINFPAPAGEFRLVARDRSETAWLGFTAPQEISRGARFATKFVTSGPLWFALGGVLLGAAAWGATHRERPALSHPFNWRVVPWLALFAYGLALLPHVDNTAAPNDAGGYLTFAKTLTQGRLLGEVRALPFEPRAERDVTLYLPSTGRPTPDGEMAPEYPPGLALQIALFALVLPLGAATVLVLWLNLLGGVVLTWRLGRVFGLPDTWAWLGAGLVGLSSLYLFQALQVQSDGPAMVWVTGAVVFAWTSRGRLAHAWLAGLFAAMAVLLRPANILCLLPVALCVIDRPKALLRTGLAGLPFALALAAFNYRMYGSPFRTGYGDVSTWWGRQFIAPTLAMYLQWLPLMFSPVVLAAFGSLRSRAFAPRARLVLWATAGSFLGFYAAYWCTKDDWFNMRFVLPAMPALTVLGLVVLRERAAQWASAIFTPARAWIGVAAAVGLLALVVTDAVRRDVLYWVHANGSHRAPVDWLMKHQPGPGVVVARMASNTVWHYSDYILLRSDHKAVQSPEFLARVASAGLPIYAINQHWERRGFEWGHGKGDGLPDVPGDWERLAVLWEGEYVVWRWHPPKPAH